MTGKKGAAMKYLSTRGKMAPVRFRDVLLEGLATDGGLAVPAAYPRVDALLGRWRGLAYAELATEILALYACLLYTSDAADE